MPRHAHADPGAQMPWAKQDWRPGDRLERRRTWFTRASSASRLSAAETRAGAGCCPHVHARAHAQEAWKRARHQDAATETPANAHHRGTCKARGSDRHSGMPCPHDGLLARALPAVRFLLLGRHLRKVCLGHNKLLISFSFFPLQVSLELENDGRRKEEAGTEKRGVTVHRKRIVCSARPPALEQV